MSDVVKAPKLKVLEYGGRRFQRVIIWFSCGAASAIAAKLALEKYGHDNCEIVYQDTGSEHPDNARFLEEFSQAIGHDIKIIRSDKYSDIWDVFEKTRYLAGIAGARCTSELKRRVAENYLNFFDDLEVLGYTVEEEKRLGRWITNNEERFIDPILVAARYSKQMCFDELDRMGVELPAMYRLGYQNNNCIGCVKGQSGYWNKIRRDFPEVFARMAKVERELDVAICKTEPTIDGVRQRIRIFLDELDPSAGRYKEEPPIPCGFLCESSADAALLARQTEETQTNE